MYKYLSFLPEQAFGFLYEFNDIVARTVTGDAPDQKVCAINAFERHLLVEKVNVLFGSHGGVEFPDMIWSRDIG